jgi:hypothetical protein
MNKNKDPIQKLTPEQQEDLASIAIKRDTMRQRLLKQRGHYRAISWLPGLVLAVLYLASVLLTKPKDVQLLVVCVGFSLWALIEFHAAGVNRRLDALIELMGDDHAA